MFLAHGARALAAGTLGVALAATAAAGLALTPPGPAPGGVIISPGVRHLEHEAKLGPSTTAQCEQTMHNAGMVGWASETTLDVEYAHTIAPGAKILLVETPGGGKAGTVSMEQIVTAEKYVISHHLGGVISQSFVATEQAVGSAAIQSLRGAYQAAYSSHVTVLAGAGDSGATGFQANQQSYYTYPVT